MRRPLRAGRFAASPVGEAIRLDVSRAADRVQLPTADRSTAKQGPARGAADPLFEAYADHGLDWPAIVRHHGSASQLDALLERRERAVKSLLHEITADLAPGVRPVLLGSRARYTVSDCDVTVVDDHAGAGALTVVGEFYRRFRERYGVAPETLMDANAFANFPELTAQGAQWESPGVKRVLTAPAFVAKRDALTLAVSYARVARDLGQLGWHARADDLRALSWEDTFMAMGVVDAHAAVRTLEPVLARAAELGSSTRQQLRARYRSLVAAEPDASRDDLWRRAGNELFAEHLEAAEPLFERWENLLDRAVTSSRVGPELQRVTLQVDEAFARASLFKVNDYASRGAMRQVFSDDTTLAHGVPGPLSAADALAALNENYAALAKGIGPYLDEGFTVAAIRGSKYAERSWGSAADLAGALDRPVLARRLQLAKGRIERLREHAKQQGPAEDWLSVRQAEWLRRNYKGPLAFAMIQRVAAEMVPEALAQLDSRKP
ncbi:MAG: hypothetical protein IPJ65_16655 [Archangiaceae bacterium]|nr:hypothetical protein [Archangiaceae bacterium]